MEKRGTKAQVSMEFLMIVGIAVLLTIPLFYIFFRQSEQMNTEISGGQIDKVASEIKDAADEIYYLGTPSKKTLTLYFPENIKNVAFYSSNGSSSIAFTVDAPGSDYEVVKWTVGSIANDSSISSNSGIHHISVEARAYDVLITDS